MTTISTEDKKKVFLHAMHLMNDGDDGSGEICKTLKKNGLTQIEDIFSLSNDQIDDLSYKENNKSIASIWLRKIWYASYWHSIPTISAQMYR